MKHNSWKWCLMAVFLWVATCNQARVAFAAEENGGGPGDRLQRLERRLNELAERQEQMMRQLGSPEARQARALRQQNFMPQGPQAAAAMRPNVREPQRLLPAPGRPGPEMAPGHKAIKDLVGLLMLCGIICNIQLAIWIYTDIRKRGEGSGLFIALALVAGIPTAIIYSIVRIGDKKA